MIDNEEKIVMCEDSIRLLSEIRALDHFIAALPPVITEAQEALRAQQLKMLGEKKQEFALLLESKRVESVKQRYEETQELRHPPRLEDCPICLDTIDVNDEASIKRLI